jgi:ergothioneine biosynthesis protein EgtB
MAEAALASINQLADNYRRVRNQTASVAEYFTTEDLTPQSMPDASPGKWHLAHTTWFFETFILQTHSPDFAWFDESFCYCFNSYYDTVGSRHARPQRGLLTRPSLDEINAYRNHVDTEISALMASATPELLRALEPLITIGLHHEMQHQELLLTDILHLLAHNPTHPVILPATGVDTPAPSLSWLEHQGGLITAGAAADMGDWQSFSYDCEQPVHKVYLAPYCLASRPVTNREWLAFMADEGYQQPLLWLSDGWAEAQQQQWQAPLYWQERDGQWYQFSFNGLRPVDLNAPVCHISFYEADAYARWAGYRLPGEFEWEHAVKNKPIDGNFLEQPDHQRRWRPTADDLADGGYYGSVWEWTQSNFSPYPGFNPQQGALGEYNGKFMCNQMVLRGGSCATPQQQMRVTYRNFFHPHQRWQFSGVRLAKDNHS